MKFRKMIILIATLLACALMFGAAAYAEELPEGVMPEIPESGSLTVTLKAQDGTVLPEVELTINKVAALKQELFEYEDGTKAGPVRYELEPDYASTGVDFTGMTEDVSNTAAQSFAAIATGGTSSQTNESGVVSFAGLEPGMYLVRQTDKTSVTALYSAMKPFIVSVSRPVDGAWTSDVAAAPKIDIIPNEPDPGTGKITVTKQIMAIVEDEIVPVIGDDVIFYVGLFSDADGKNLVGVDYLKPIHIVANTRESVTFDKLPAGTFYVFETDARGVPVWDGMFNGVPYIVEYSAGQSVELKDGGEGKLSIENIYSEPPGFPVGVRVEIKKIVKNNSRIEDFYAGAFVKTNAGYELVENVKLEIDGWVEILLPLGGEAGTDNITYYIFETNAAGKRVDAGFRYKVEGEAAIKYSISHVFDKVTITNTFKSTNVRTGDSANMPLYIGLLVASVAAIGGAGFVFYKKRKK